MAAGQASDYTGAAALSLPDWVCAVGYPDIELPTVPGDELER